MSDILEQICLLSNQRSQLTRKINKLQAEYDLSQRKPGTAPYRTAYDASPAMKDAIAAIRDYAREYMGNPHIFNNKLKNSRSIKIWKGLTQKQFDMHTKYIQERLPPVKFVKLVAPTPCPEKEKKFYIAVRLDI